MNTIQDQFPILKQIINGNPLIYFDNAATTQKPQSVIDSITTYYNTSNSNVHRGIHTLAERATHQYEQSRTQVQHFIHAKYSEEIIFTKGTTEGINLIASTYGKTFLKKGDEIIITELEHHSNIVPWQVLQQEIGIILRFAPVTSTGEIDMKQFEKLLTEKTKLVAVSHISNALGTINPIENIIRLAHHNNAKILIDGAQAVAHLPIDVQKLDCDFYVFSGHKMYGPTGIGVVYAKKDILERIPPYQTGGEMVQDVTLQQPTYQQSPQKFEAGTPNIAGAIGLAAAIQWLKNIGMNTIQQHEQDLVQYGTQKLGAMKGIKIIGNTKQKIAIFSLVHPTIHPHDIGTLLDQHGIAVRAGQHCAHPLMKKLRITGTTRASLAIYNTKQEIDQLAEKLEKAIQLLTPQQ